MARFKYLGEPSFGVVATPGPCTAIKVPLKNGTIQTLTPISPATEFVIGADIGYEITDERAVRSMRTETYHYEEIV
jgi:hypothetical protein